MIKALSGMVVIERGKDERLGGSARQRRCWK
jgi:hypothetical protein